MEKSKFIRNSGKIWFENAWTIFSWPNGSIFGNSQSNARLL